MKHPLGSGHAKMVGRHPDRHIRKLIRALVAAATLPFLVAFPFLLDLPGPLAIAFAVTACWFLAVAMAIAQRPVKQNVLVSLASLSLGLAACEVGASFANSRAELPGADLTDDTVEIPDPDLGYRLQPDQRIEAREIFGEKVVFDVIYTVDNNGFRMIPVNPIAPCGVVFFADSFTFGWGLPDNATMPSQFVVASEGRYRGYNLSINGYGPHQMLRSIQTGGVERVVRDGPVNLVVYQAILAHVARVAGRTSWDLRGPRYAIVDNGAGVTYVGPFNAGTSAAVLQFLLNSSELFTFLHRVFLAVDLPTTEDVPLYVAVLKQTRREVERRYGPNSFVVLVWRIQDEVDEFGIDLDSELAKAGLEPISIGRILPDLDANRKAYTFPPVDWHPNADANRQIAQFLAREIGPQTCRRGNLAR